MVMNTTEHVLLIMLSAFLALFLLLAIWVLVEALVLMRKAQHLMERAEKAVASAEAAVSVIKKTAGPLGLMRAARLLFDLVQHKNHKEK
jgi:hypothetical protein